MRGTVSEAANAKIFLIQLFAPPLVCTVPFVKGLLNFAKMRISGGIQNYLKCGGMPKRGGKMENFWKEQIALRKKKIKKIIHWRNKTISTFFKFRKDNATLNLLITITRVKQ